MTANEFEQAGVAIDHHFAGGAYAKVTEIPAGVELRQHSHPHAHLSFLVQGTADLIVDGVAERHVGFKVLEIPAGVVHSVRAVTPVTWACLWATDDTNPETVDSSILAG